MISQRPRHHTRIGLLLVLLLGPLTAAPVQADAIYQRIEDHPFATLDGLTLYMDIFIPTGEAPPQFAPGNQGQGLGILQVVSGSWHSDRSRFRPHEVAQVYNLLCARGYTMFAVRPGDRDNYTLKEMLEHVRMGIRYVKAHAAQWDIDPERLGLMGASAGGHLAALAALDSQPGAPDHRNNLLRQDTSVAATALFFPPTDFMDWKDGDFLSQAPGLLSLFFAPDEQPQSLAEITERVKAISPLYRVAGNHPPFFIAHGDADSIVPVTQSRKLVAALEDADVAVQYQEIRGVGHNWPTLPVQVLDMVNWFDRQLSTSECE